MTLAATIDHQRAQAVQQIMKDRFAGEDESTKIRLKKYRTLALGAGTFIRQVGLLQFVAFYLSKNKPEHQSLLEDLFAWLQQSEVTAGTAAEVGEKAAIAYAGPNPGSNLGAALLQRDTQQRALLEYEADLFLGWLRRFIEGRHQELKGNDDRNEGPADA